MDSNMNDPKLNEALLKNILERTSDPTKASGNTPKRAKLVRAMTGKYDENHKEHAKERWKLKNIKDHPNGQMAKDYKKRGVDPNKNQTCSETGCTKPGKQWDHVDQSKTASKSRNPKLQILCVPCHNDKTNEERVEHSKDVNQHGAKPKTIKDSRRREGTLTEAGRGSEEWDMLSQAVKDRSLQGIPTIPNSNARKRGGKKKKREMGEKKNPTKITLNPHLYTPYVSNNGVARILFVYKDGDLKRNFRLANSAIYGSDDLVTIEVKTAGLITRIENKKHGKWSKHHLKMARQVAMDEAEKANQDIDWDVYWPWTTIPSGSKGPEAPGIPASADISRKTAGAIRRLRDDPSDSRPGRTRTNTASAGEHDEPTPGPQEIAQEMGEEEGEEPISRQRDRPLPPRAQDSIHHEKLAKHFIMLGLTRAAQDLQEKGLLPQGEKAISDHVKSETAQHVPVYAGYSLQGNIKQSESHGTEPTSPGIFSKGPRRQYDDAQQFEANMFFELAIVPKGLEDKLYVGDVLAISVDHLVSNEGGQPKIKTSEHQDPDEYFRRIVEVLSEKGEPYQIEKFYPKCEKDQDGKAILGSWKESPEEYKARISSSNFDERLIYDHRNQKGAYVAVEKASDGKWRYLDDAGSRLPRISMLIHKSITSPYDTLDLDDESGKAVVKKHEVIDDLVDPENGDQIDKIHNFIETDETGQTTSLISLSDRAAQKEELRSGETTRGPYSAEKWHEVFDTQFGAVDLIQLNKRDLLERFSWLDEGDADKLVAATAEGNTLDHYEKLVQAGLDKEKAERLYQRTTGDENSVFDRNWHVMDYSQRKPLEEKAFNKLVEDRASNAAGSHIGKDGKGRKVSISNWDSINETIRKMGHKSATPKQKRDGIVAKHSKKEFLRNSKIGLKELERRCDKAKSDLKKIEHQMSQVGSQSPEYKELEGDRNTLEVESRQYDDLLKRAIRKVWAHAELVGGAGRAFERERLKCKKCDGTGKIKFDLETEKNELEVQMKSSAHRTKNLKRKFKIEIADINSKLKKITKEDPKYQELVVRKKNMLEYYSKAEKGFKAERVRFDKALRRSADLSGRTIETETDCYICDGTGLPRKETEVRVRGEGVSESPMVFEKKKLADIISGKMDKSCKTCYSSIRDMSTGTIPIKNVYLRITKDQQIGPISAIIEKLIKSGLIVGEQWAGLPGPGESSEEINWEDQRAPKKVLSNLAKKEANELISYVEEHSLLKLSKLLGMAPSQAEKVIEILSKGNRIKGNLPKFKANLLAVKLSKAMFAKKTLVLGTDLKPEEAETIKAALSEAAGKNVWFESHACPECEGTKIDKSLLSGLTAMWAQSFNKITKESLPWYDEFLKKIMKAEVKYENKLKKQNKRKGVLSGKDYVVVDRRRDAQGNAVEWGYRIGDRDRFLFIQDLLDEIGGKNRDDCPDCHHGIKIETFDELESPLESPAEKAARGEMSRAQANERFLSGTKQSTPKGSIWKTKGRKVKLTSFQKEQLINSKKSVTVDNDRYTPCDRCGGEGHLGHKPGLDLSQSEVFVEIRDDPYDHYKSEYSRIVRTRPEIAEGDSDPRYLRSERFFNKLRGSKKMKAAAEKAIKAGEPTAIKNKGVARIVDVKPEFAIEYGGPLLEKAKIISLSEGHVDWDNIYVSNKEAAELAAGRGKKWARLSSTDRRFWLDNARRIKKNEYIIQAKARELAADKFNSQRPDFLWASLNPQQKTNYLNQAKFGGTMTIGDSELESTKGGVTVKLSDLDGEPMVKKYKIEYSPAMLRIWRISDLRMADEEKLKEMQGPDKPIVHRGQGSRSRQQGRGNRGKRGKTEGLTKEMGAILESLD